MRRIVFIIMILVALTITAPVHSAQFMGGYGYLHTNSALVMPPGALNISNYIRGYASLANDERDYTISNATSALATTFGYSRTVEIGFTQILYQNLNLTIRDEVDNASMVPGDTYIRFKFGGYQITPNIYWGIMPNARYRVAKFHDIQLEPLSTNSVEAELMFLCSYFQKPLYPDDGLSVHFNLSYTNHNDGKPLASSTQTINFLFGFLQPRNKTLDFGAELYGSFFIQEPSESTFGRENWVYLTPMAKYDLFAGLKFILGMDILVLAKDNTTIYGENADYDLRIYPNYSTWRLTGKISFMPSTSFFAANTFEKSSEVASVGREKRSFGGRSALGSGADRQSLFKWAVEERGGEIEAIDIDLAKIRQERKKIEAELERLKKDLEK